MEPYIVSAIWFGLGVLLGSLVMAAASFLVGAHKLREQDSDEAWVRRW